MMVFFVIFDDYCVDKVVLFGSDVYYSVLFLVFECCCVIIVLEVVCCELEDVVCDVSDLVVV